MKIAAFYKIKFVSHHCTKLITILGDYISTPSLFVVHAWSAMKRKADAEWLWCKKLAPNAHALAGCWWHESSTPCYSNGRISDSTVIGCECCISLTQNQPLSIENLKFSSRMIVFYYKYTTAPLLSNYPRWHDITILTHTLHVLKSC